MSPPRHAPPRFRINVDNQPVVAITMWHDEYERTCGDGLFTCPWKNDACTTSAEYEFTRKEDRFWWQTGGEVICGIDSPEYRQELVRILAREYDRVYGDTDTCVAVRHTKMSISRINTPEMVDRVVSAKPNELPRPLFVFKVLEHFMRTAAEPLAEKILSYIGEETRHQPAGLPPYSRTFGIFSIGGHRVLAGADH
jgi:hypothetical protein